MKIAKTRMLTGTFILLSALPTAAGWAASDAEKSTADAAKNLPDGTEVMITGMVDDFDSRHPFTLRDASGAIEVDLSSAKPIVLKNGENVTITGEVNKGLLGTDIAATAVTINTTVGEKIGNAIDSMTGQNAASPIHTVSVQTLPDVGQIKINGVVDEVDGAKNFTLRDSTGRVNVVITSGELAALRKGVEVTVIGNVDKGVLGKSIDATEVDIRSSNSAVATP